LGNVCILADAGNLAEGFFEIGRPERHRFSGRPPRQRLHLTMRAWALQSWAGLSRIAAGQLYFSFYLTAQSYTQIRELYPL